MIKGSIRLLLVLNLLVMIWQVVVPEKANAASFPGYFTGISDSNGGDFVLPQSYSSSLVAGGVAAIPDSVNSLSEFENFLENKYKNGNSWERVGAAYIIQDMRNKNDHSMPSQAVIDDWKNTLNTWASSGMTVNWDGYYAYNGTQGACINTMNIKNHAAGDSDPEDVAKYSDCGAESDVIIFSFPNGNQYAIKRRCANPVGNGGVPLLDWRLQGHTRVDGTSGKTVSATGQSVVFTNWVHSYNNTSSTNYTTATSITITVEGQYTGKSGGAFTRFQCTAGGINEGASSCSLPSSSVDISVGADKYAANVTYAFPSSAQPGDKYCEHITYTEANGPATGSGVSTAVCVTYTPPNYDPMPAVNPHPNCADNNLQFDVHDDNGAPLYTVYAWHGNNNSNGDGNPDDWNNAVRWDGGSWVGSGPPTTGVPASGRGDGTIAVPFPGESQAAGNSGWTIAVFARNVNSVGQDDTRTSIFGSYFGTLNTSGWTGPCYSAACSVSINNPVVPPDGVERNKSFTMTVTLTNTGPAELSGGFGVNFPNNSGWTWGQSSPYPGYPSGQSIPSGQSRSYTIALGYQNPFMAPNDYTSRTIPFYPDFVGYWPIGSDCGRSVTPYDRFDIEVTPNFVGVDWQDPSPAITYNINGSLIRGPTINANAYAWLTYAPLGGDPVTGPTVDPPGGKHGPYNHNYGVNIPDGNFTYPYPTVKNGDQFCAWGKISPGHGWYGAGGPVNTTDEIKNNCEKVTNKPYFKVYGSSISAGGNFRAASGGSCSGGGELAGWFNNMNSATYSYGSSAALSALALKQIVGFGSAQNVGVFGRSPTELTLANTTPVNASNYSPNLAGSYDSDPITVNRCLTSQQAGPSATAVGNTASVDTLDRSNTGTGPFILTGGTVPSGKNVSLFVDGDVYIDPGAARGIKYADTGWTKDTVPSFVLHATGNIYISPEVTVLDGLYVSEPSSSASPKGTIYTCAKRSSFSFSAMSRSELYNGCKNQLTIHGSFVAKRINLMRSYGSLRDEKPTVSTPTIVQPGTGAVGFTRWTCPVAGQQWNHWYQVLSTPAQPDQPDCSSNWYLDKPERTMGYVLPSTRAGQDGSERLCYHGSRSWDAASTDSDFRYYTSPNNCGSGDSIIGAAQSTNGSASGAPLIPVYSVVLDGRHFYTTSYGEAGATAIAFYIYQNADGGALTTMATNVAPPNLGALVCSNAGLKSSPRQTCAAEVFDVSPELFISRQAIKQSDSSTGLWDSVTSLPPVL